MGENGVEGKYAPTDYSEVVAEMEKIVEHTFLINAHNADAAVIDVVQSSSRFIAESLLKGLADAGFLNDQFTEAGLIEQLHSGSMTRLAPDEGLISAS